MEKLKMAAAAICAFGSYIFGGMDAIMSILLIFICIDFLSGFIKAWTLHQVDSSKMYTGGVKKIGILLVVAVATQLDTLVLNDHVILRTVAISYYIANEGFSILENWGALGLPLPKVLKEVLAKLKDGDKNDSGK